MRIFERLNKFCCDLKYKISGIMCIVHLKNGDQSLRLGNRNGGGGPDPGLHLNYKVAHDIVGLKKILFSITNTSIILS